MDEFDVVLSLTTWKKRLVGDNVLNTLKSLLAQRCHLRTHVVISIFKDDM